MKNLFKFGFVALAISLSVAACGEKKGTDGGDSSAVDTAVVDTTASVDTTAAATTDSAAAPADSAAAPAAH